MRFLQGNTPELRKLSFQHANGYPEETTCPNCEHKARLLGVLDDEKGQELCRQPKPEGVEHWPHDSCSIAVYLCGHCLEVNGLFTQA